MSVGQSKQSTNRFTWLYRKCLTKPIWYWETRRPYPIRECVFAFPPLPSDPAAAFTLTVLTTPRTVNNAAWALYSLRKGLEKPAAIHLVVDGELRPERVSQLKALFPGLTLSNTREHVAAVRDRIPSLERLARMHPMAGKLAAILNLQEYGDLLFSDDDVLAFKVLSEINEAVLGRERTALYLREKAAGSVQEEPSIKEGLESLGLGWVRDINVGLMWLPRKNLDLDLCEKILAASPEVRTWFPDTMVMAGLLALQPHQVFPDSYAVTTQRQFFFESDVDYDQISVRHFVGPVRHLMYLRGMSLLKRRWIR